MPSANPFAPVLDVGGSAQVGPARAGTSLNLGLNGGAVGDHHAAAAYILLGLLALVLLHKSKYRFSTTVG